MKIMNFSNMEKQKFLPPIGFKFVMGGMMWETIFVNIGRMTFTAKFLGRATKTESPIISPNSPEGQEILHKKGGNHE